MPIKPLKPCKYLRCPKLTLDKYCDDHKDVYVKEKATTTERGYDSKWISCRDRFLKANPLCVRCKEKGR